MTRFFATPFVTTANAGIFGSSSSRRWITASLFYILPAFCVFNLFTTILNHFSVKKLVLSAFLAIGLSAVHTAQAQVGPLVNLIGAGLGLGTRLALQPKLTPEQKAAQQAAAAKEAADGQVTEHVGTAAPTELVMHRTPADKLPKQAAAQITDLEAQLDRCHAAMLTSPAGTVCTTEQRAAIQAAAISVARAKPGFNLAPYQQEMAYYMAEDARRQQAATPAAPAK